MYSFHSRKDWLDGQKNVDFLVDLTGHLLMDRREQFHRLPDPTQLEATGCWPYYYHKEEDECYSTKTSSSRS
jgi:hypothetical protein